MHMENQENYSVYIGPYRQGLNDNKSFIKIDSKMKNRFLVLRSSYDKSQQIFQGEHAQMSQCIKKSQNLLQQILEQSQRNTASEFEGLSNIEHEVILNIKDLSAVHNCQQTLNCQDKQIQKVRDKFKTQFGEETKGLINSQQAISRQIANCEQKFIQTAYKIRLTHNQHDKQINQLVSIFDSSLAQIEDTLQILVNQKYESWLQLQTDVLALSASLDAKIKAQRQLMRKQNAMTQKLIEKLIEKITFI